MQPVIAAIRRGWRWLFLWGILGVLAGPVSAEVVDRVAAVVGSDVITWSEIYELGGDHIEQQATTPAVRRRLELEVLEVLVERRLVEQEMKRLELDVTDADIERALADIARQNSLERDQLRAEIERSGMEWEVYLDEMTASLRDMKFNQQVLAPRVSIGEEDLRDRYRRTRDDLAGPPQVRIRAVFIPPEEGETPEALQERGERARRALVKGGEPFEDVLARFSPEAYAERGGEMGTFQPGELMEPLDAVAFSTEEQGFSPVVTTSRGLYILQVLERIPAEPPPFEEVEEQLRQQLMAEEIAEARQRWVSRARRRTAVGILLESPEDLG